MEARTTDDEQAARWNGPAAQVWVRSQAMVDELLKPLEDLLVAEVSAAGGGSVLDVGCGTGGTTVAVARRLGAAGHSVGIDISGPMIDAAEARSERAGTRVRFIRASAQDHAFEAGAFDTVISRFGVMFFSDPVAAFTNLRHATKDGGALRLITWRDPKENPFMTVAERAAAPFLPDFPASPTDGVGRFSFAHPDKVRPLLEGGGWTEVDFRPIDVVCTMAETELVPYFTGFGPLGQRLREEDERTRALVIEGVRPAYDPYMHGDEVRYTAACWLISARAGG